MDHVQPFAVLMIVDPATFNIRLVSNNSESLLRLEPRQALRKSLLDYLDASALRYLKRLIREGKPYIHVKHTTFYADQFNRVDVTFIAYLEAGCLYLEFERFVDSDALHYMSDTQSINAALSECSTLKQL